MRFFTQLQLGPKQSMTPEGFLLCEAVPIARTGEQTYAVGELPLAVLPGPDGLIRVMRLESEVFRAETIASFEGKPTTLDHPPEGVDATNARELTIGHAQNVRRGEGLDADLLLADLLITDAEAIEAVRITADPVTGVPVIPLREVSCGYDAEYRQDTPGIAYQTNIIGNHVALVKRGRAGSRCSIQDKEAPQMKEKTLLQKLLGAIRTKDSAAIEAAAADAEKEIETPEEKAAREAEDKKTADAQAHDARMTKIEDSIAALAKAVDAFKPFTKEDGGEKETADAATVAKVADTAMRAEILVPGYAMPTADSVPTLDAVAGVQRAVLGRFGATADGRALLESFGAGTPEALAAMTADALNVAFVGASEISRMRNNAGVQGAPAAKSFGKVPTIAEINAANQKHYQ